MSLLTDIVLDIEQYVKWYCFCLASAYPHFINWRRHFVQYVSTIDIHIHDFNEQAPSSAGRPISENAVTGDAISLPIMVVAV